MDVVTAVAPEVTVRPAVPRDNDALCRLFASVSMESDLDLAIRRDPDFFALYRIQGPQWECWLGETDERLAGLGAILVRDGYLDGRSVRVGYLGDLRVASELQGRKLVPRFYGPVLRDAAERFDCDVFLTTIIASNRRAIRALTGPRAREAGIPPYEFVRSFGIRAVYLTVPLPWMRTHYRVERGTESSLSEIASFLDADGRRRPFGYAFDETELRRRLAEWPGLEISSFYLARDPNGALVGCAAVWDPHDVKRTVVRGYAGGMRRVRRVYNAAAATLRFSPLPAPGSELRYSYATHVAVPSGDPAVLRALMRRIYDDQRKTGRTFVAFCAFDDDPLGAAFRGFPYTDLKTNLYAVPAPGRDLPPGCFAAGPPGFEMALV
ncbi:MAG: GNAT family N-acetyltransferase [Actinomycetota bacterium]